MLTKKCCSQIRGEITEEWRKIAFHNEEITVEEMLRDYELANEDYKCNLAGKIVTRIGHQAWEDGRIERMEKWFTISTRNITELKRWLNKIKNIQVIKWITTRYDLKVQRIEMIRDNDVKKVVLILKAKYEDEGFEGGAFTLWYENERLNEEWRVNENRKIKN